MRLSLGSGEDLGSRAATTERQADQAKAPDHRHPGRRFGDFRNQADARTAAEAEFFGIERLPADDAVVEFERSQVRREVQRDRAGDEIAGRRPRIAAALAGAAAGIAVDANIPISAETIQRWEAARRVDLVEDVADNDRSAGEAAAQNVQSKIGRASGRAIGCQYV